MKKLKTDDRLYVQSIIRDAQANNRLADSLPRYTAAHGLNPEWLETMKRVWAAEKALTDLLGLSMTRIHALFAGTKTIANYFDETGTPIKGVK